MAKIINIKGRQVFDSRGNPTVEAEIFSDDGNHISAIVPSGASTGAHEAYELRDKENQNYFLTNLIPQNQTALLLQKPRYKKSFKKLALIRMN